MIEYLACGNVMSDEVVQPDGFHSERHMGGPAFFALSGIRLWTKSCKLVSSVGADFADTYGAWMRNNGVSQESVRVEAEHTSCYELSYNEDGSGRGARSYYGEENLGYLKTHPDRIDDAATRDVKGIYMAQGADRVIWKKLEGLKIKYGFQIMWELEYFNSGRDLERVKEVMPIADMWSLNYNEASRMFDIPRENHAEIINELMKLPIEFTFFRVGKAGAYAVTRSNAWFCPAVDIAPYVDQTGCGNCSTGAAMYARVAGYEPAMVVTMANIASGYNCAQYGPYPLYTDEVMAQARALSTELVKKVKACAPDRKERMTCR